MTKELSDQRQMWNRKHAAGEHSGHKHMPNDFATEIAGELVKGTRLLEIGCGVGADARFFAQHGVDVLATDISDVVIRQNQAEEPSSRLRFEVLNCSKPLPYADETFAAVYAFLSLHYFPDSKTREVFHEIARVLQSKGRLYFACKSTNDPLYGDGEAIEPNLYVRNHHIRHFFTADYCHEVLKDMFEITRLVEAAYEYVDKPSVLIECWATKQK